MKIEVRIRRRDREGRSNIHHADKRMEYLLWQLPGIACLKEDNGSRGCSGFGSGWRGFGKGCKGSTSGEAKNGPPLCDANANAWNCCCCPKRDNTAINRAPVHWTSGTRIDPPSLLTYPCTKYNDSPFLLNYFASEFFIGWFLSRRISDTKWRSSSTITP